MNGRMASQHNANRGVASQTRVAAMTNCAVFHFSKVLQAHYCNPKTHLIVKYIILPGYIIMFKENIMSMYMHVVHHN